MNTDQEVDCTLCMRHETTHTSGRRSFRWPSRRPPTAGNPAFLDTLVLFAKKCAWHSPGANLCLSVFIRGSSLLPFSASCWSTGGTWVGSATYFRKAAIATMGACEVERRSSRSGADWGSPPPTRPACCWPLDAELGVAFPVLRSFRQTARNPASHRRMGA
jgi:hypothetical protein